MTACGQLTFTIQHEWVSFDRLPTETMTRGPMHIETNVDLQPFNTFGLPARAHTLIRIRSEAGLAQVVRNPVYAAAPKFVLGGGSNVVFRESVPHVILKVEITGRRLFRENPTEWIVEAGAGENWHELVAWTLANGWPGLENLALIPGTVGAAPIQNIGAYGVEFNDRFLSLDAVDLTSGQPVSLSAEQCCLSYRDSVFKKTLAGRCLVTRVRLKLPRPWRAVLDYPDLRRRQTALGSAAPDAGEVFEWVCASRRAKLPDPEQIGNAGSFFKNPVVERERHCTLLAREPNMVSYPLTDGRFKLSAGWMIEACGWKGRHLGHVGVYDRQALVLINLGGASHGELMTLAEAVQDSVYDRFGIRLEIEPVVL